MERPFTDQEKRFIVAEALKSSGVPIETMLAILDGDHGQPVWSDMVIPYGRTINQCVAALHELRAGHSPTASSLPLPSSTKRKSGASELLDPSLAGPAPKRRQSSTVTTREIKPRPASNGDPASHTSSPAPPAGKKRGRPSNVVLEQRRLEALARGEILGSTSTGAKGRLSTGGNFTPIAPTPAAEPTGEANAAVPFEGHQVDTLGLEDSAMRKKTTRPPSRSGKGPASSEPTPEGLREPELAKPAGFIVSNMGSSAESLEETAPTSEQQSVSGLATTESGGNTTHTNPAPIELQTTPETRPLV